jgi:hypothetical protein
VLGAVGTNVVNELSPVAKEKITGDKPLHINVREDPQGGSDGFSVATNSVEGLDSRLAQANGCDSLFDVAKQAGAVDVGQSIHDVLLEGRTFRDVTIVDLRVRILKRAYTRQGDSRPGHGDRVQPGHRPPLRDVLYRRKRRTRARAARARRCTSGDRLESPANVRLRRVQSGSRAGDFERGGRRRARRVYADPHGRLIVENTILDLRGGLIVRQHEVEAWD